MSSLRIAVTGGSGRVGSAVVKCLLQRGHQVVNLDRRQASKPLCRFAYVDLTRREQVQPALEQVDAICHLGEIPSVWGHSPEHVFANNTAAGSIVLQIAVDLGIKRVIATSSIQVYGLSKPDPFKPQRLPFDESHPLQPQQAYALAKIAVEQYAQMAAANHGLSVALFRLPWVTDWDFPASGESPQWPWLKQRMHEVEELGAYVHASDAALAYALAVENPRPGCEIYQLCAREGLVDRPVRAWMQEAYPELPPLPADWPRFRSPYLADKLRAHVGWNPTWNFLDFYRAKFGGDPSPSA